MPDWHLFREVDARRDLEVLDGRKGGDEELDADEGEAAIARWEAQKARERGARVRERGALGGVSLALPALLRAHRIGEKASPVGYDWPSVEAVRA